MFEIKDLLSRFENLLNKGQGNKKILVDLLESVVKIKINTENIRIQNGVLYLDTKPIYKNEILIKKSQLLQTFKESLGKKAPIDIR